MLHTSMLQHFKVMWVQNTETAHFLMFFIIPLLEMTCPTVHASQNLNSVLYLSNSDIILSQEQEPPPKKKTSIL